jgi:hypothetical protein
MRRKFMAMAAATAAAGLGASSAHAELAFGPPVQFPVQGIFPQSLVVRDVTGDGKIDVVVGARAGNGVSNNSISVLAGDGTGTFGAPQAFPTTSRTGFPTTRIAGGDLDGDGDIDVAATTTVSTDAPLVGVLRNDGTGDFSQRTDLQGGRGPLGIVVAPLTGTDAALDIATANFNSNTVSVFANDGSGVFAHGPGAITIGGITSAPEGIAAGDLDRDGLTDLVVTSRNAGPRVRVLRQTAPGTFTASAPFAVGSIPTWVTTADLNRDGHLDALVSNASSGNFSVLLGDGTGALAAPTTMAGGGPDPQPEQAVLRDLDGDGDGDLATSHSDSPGYLTLHEGDGAGGFAAPVILMLPANNATGLAARDVNRDGRPDLVVTNSGGANISVLLNTGPGRDPECSDEMDNDGDGQVDHPADPHCSGPLDDHEDVCSPKGPVSGAVDTQVLPPLRQVAPPVAETVRGLNCDTVLPAERALGLAPPP